MSGQETTSRAIDGLLLTIRELADELRLDQRTVYRHLKEGKLPIRILRIGQSPRVRRADLERYLTELAEQTEAAIAERKRRAEALVWNTPHVRRGRPSVQSAPTPER